MASTKVTYVTGAAKMRHKEVNYSSHDQPHLHQTTPSQLVQLPVGQQVSFVDGKCSCCPYGYHIDLDFLNFCRDVENGSTLRNLKRIQKAKRKLRKSMEIMLDEQENILADPNSAPPDVVHSTEAGRLMHMINYERSATHHILNQIDTSVNQSIANLDGGSQKVSRRYISSDSEDNAAPTTPRISRRQHETTGMTPSFSTSGRTDSLSSLSSASTMSSEHPGTYHASVTSQNMQQKQSSTVTHKQQEQEYLLAKKIITEITENPVIEMATAEMKHYTSASSAELAPEPVFPPKTVPVRTQPEPDNLQPVREAMTASLSRLRELEEQVKAIPILQVRISVLKEEKRLLNLQLKSAQAKAQKPEMFSIGVGDYRADIDEKMEPAKNTPRFVGIPRTFDPVATSPRTPPATLPKPVKTSTVGVGDHTVFEPYNIQPDLPTGYTICENEVRTEIYSSSYLETEKMKIMSKINAPTLSRSFQIPNAEDREQRSAFSQPQPQFTINQIQRAAPKPMTRTFGVGDGNVFEDSSLHVHEKEFKTVIIGQNDKVAKRNVGIECRVPTRDVGVSFKCDEEKPATRTVGVNVNYDTSGILTSLDFKGETQLRMALRGVLQRNVRSIGTNCNFRPALEDKSVTTDTGFGVSVGCGDEENRVDVEIRPITQRKVVGTLAKPESTNKCVSTEKGWVLDAGTNTVSIDKYHKSMMTDRVKVSFAAVNTDLSQNRSNTTQTETKVFSAIGAIRQASSNTERVPTFSTGMTTDVVQKCNVAVGTLYTESKNTTQEKVERKPLTFNRGVGDGKITLEMWTENLYQIKTNTAEEEEGRSSTETFEITRRTVVPAQTSQTFQTSSNRSFISDSSVTRDSKTSPVREEPFSETITEYFVITNEGKQLIDREKVSSRGGKSYRSASKNAAVAAVAGGGSSYIDRYGPKSALSSHTYSYGSDSNTNNNSPTSSFSKSESSMGSSGSRSSSKMNNSNYSDRITETKSSSLSSGNSQKFGGSIDSMDNSKISTSSFGGDAGVSTSSYSSSSSFAVSTNPYKTVENLAAASANLDSLDSQSTSSGISTMSKTSSEGNLFKERSPKNRSVVQSMETIYDIRRAGSVEDFMPEDIKKYMSIDPGKSKDSGFGEEMVQRFSEKSTSVNSGPTSGMRMSRTLVKSSRTGDKFTVSEKKIVEDPEGNRTVTYSSSVDGSGQIAGGDMEESGSSVDANTYDGREIGRFGSLDRKTGKLRSIMKHRKEEEMDTSQEKRGITFDESVTGGTGSSSEEHTSDSESSASYEEGSYDSRQGEVIYKCKDDEAVAQGIPGAHMFDQNIRETYELSSETRAACDTLATYLVDSTKVQTKELNTSRSKVQEEWFQVSSRKLSIGHQVEDYLTSVNEISKRLLEYIVNMTDSNGNTAIHYCISHCNLDIASLLLDSQMCDINKQNKAGYTPIMLAGLSTVQNRDQRDVIRRLFAAGNIDARAQTTQQTALMLSASHGKTEMVKLLVTEGADLNLQDVDGSTALMCACEHGHLDIVNFLLAQPNINADAVDNEGSSALNIAMEAGHKDVGVVLYKHLNFSRSPTSPQLRVPIKKSFPTESLL